MFPDTVRRRLNRHRHANRLARFLNAAQARLAAAGVGLSQRGPILRCYLQRAAGARAHIPVDYRAPAEAFEPIAARYPVFRITAAQEAAVCERGDRRLQAEAAHIGTDRGVAA